MKKLLLAAALTFATCTFSQGATVTFVNVTGTNDFNYSLTITSGENLVAGDFFTIFDFAGYNGVSAPANFNVSTGLSTPNASNPNDPTLTDITFTYTGSTVSNTTMTGITLNSLYSNQVTDDWYVKTTNKGNGNAKVTVGTVTVAGMPVTPSAPVSGVPEPATFAMLGTGLVGLAVLKRR